jgi:hypothetical protein
MNYSQIALMVFASVGFLLMVTLFMVTLLKSNVYNNKQKNEYTGFGSSLNDALNGRKYRYDILMSSEAKEKNDNKNEYIF